MLSDYDLIMSRDIDLPRLRHGAYIRRLAISFAHGKPGLVYELVEKTFDLIATATFAGPFAYQGSHPTVKMWMTRQLVVVWSAIMKQKQMTSPPDETSTIPASVDPICPDESEFDIDTDTTRF